MRNRGDRTEVGSDMTPMIDCVFLLLIFFLCATQFRLPEGVLDSWLPRDRGTDVGPREYAPGCRIVIEREGNRIICWADETSIPFASEYASDSIGASQRDFDIAYDLRGPDMRAVERHIESRQGAYRGVSAKGLPVTIDFAGDVPSRYVVDVVNICARLGIADVAVAAPEALLD